MTTERMQKMRVVVKAATKANESLARASDALYEITKSISFGVNARQQISQRDVDQAGSISNMLKRRIADPVIQQKLELYQRSVIGASEALLGNNPNPFLATKFIRQAVSLATAVDIMISRMPAPAKAAKAISEARVANALKTLLARMITDATAQDISRNDIDQARRFAIGLLKNTASPNIKFRAQKIINLLAQVGDAIEVDQWKPIRRYLSDASTQVDFIINTD